MGELSVLYLDQGVGHRHVHHFENASDCKFGSCAFHIDTFHSNEIRISTANTEPIK